ncbi:hypothetical protein RND71_024271 [Anisodus tanguticus]|uniref:RRM domain-containing protein n=1 Tax=Anisodus tanguticus TaxID=243964 RepID=A0AAE1VCC4_9SOLA|nr:hypothetical protein RND71_024271 [Anisodus tanguticus]
MRYLVLSAIEMLLNLVGKKYFILDQLLHLFVIHHYSLSETAVCLHGRGLSKRTTSEGLQEDVAKFGQVDHAKVVTDRVSGYSKGYGFVRYATLEDAEAGIKGMDGQSNTQILYYRKHGKLEYIRKTQ